MEQFAFLIGVVIAIWLTFILPAQMAAARGRSVIIWFLLTCWLSFIITIPLLLFLGDVEDNDYKRPPMPR